MRIAYLTSQYPAPSHTFIRREVHALRDRGVDIDTFSIRRPPSSSAPADRKDTDSTWYVLPAKPWRLLASHAWGFSQRPSAYLATLALALRHRVPGWHGFVWGVFYFVEAIVLSRELHRREIGHIHNHFANAAATVGLLASRYLGASWSLTLHGSSEFDYPAGPVLPDKIRAADFVACASHFMRAQGMRLVEPEHWGKMFIARCGVDLAAIPPRDYARDRGSTTIVSVGRLAPEKGQLGLLEAVANLKNRGAEVELVLVGDGPEKARVLAAIERLSLGGHCRLLGRLPEDEAIAAISRADIFALSSFIEGLPVVLMEALALEVAAVAPGVAGIPELVEQEKTGLLFPPGDWPALERCLQRLVDDPDLRVALGQAGRRRVEIEFDIRRAVEPLRAQFDALPTRNNR